MQCSINSAASRESWTAAAPALSAWPVDGWIADERKPWLVRGHVGVCRLSARPGPFQQRDYPGAAALAGLARANTQRGKKVFFPLYLLLVTSRL